MVKKQNLTIGMALYKPREQFFPFFICAKEAMSGTGVPSSTHTLRNVYLILVLLSTLWLCHN